MIIDDGTDIIECKKYFDESLNEERPLFEFQLGDVVMIQGTLIFGGENRDRLGIQITNGFHNMDHSEEILHWVTAMKLMDEVYNQSHVTILGSKDQNTKSSIISIGCSCSTSQILKEQLLFCQCVSSNLFKPTNMICHEGEFASDILQYLIDRYEKILPPGNHLLITLNDIISDIGCLKKASKYITKLNKFNESESSIINNNNNNGNGTDKSIKRSKINIDNPKCSQLLTNICEKLIKEGVLHSISTSSTPNLLLVSKERVLKPYIENALGINSNSSLNDTPSKSSNYRNATSLDKKLLDKLKKILPNVPEWRWMHVFKERFNDEEGSWCMENIDDNTWSDEEL